MYSMHIFHYILHFSFDLSLSTFVPASANEKEARGLLKSAVERCASLHVQYCAFELPNDKCVIP